MIRYGNGKIAIKENSRINIVADNEKPESGSGSTDGHGCADSTVFHDAKVLLSQKGFIRLKKLYV